MSCIKCKVLLNIFDIKKHILIIAGGSGTRFWPHSRKGKPKQLLKIWDKAYSLFSKFD